jgi:transposase-like protein
MQCIFCKSKDIVKNGKRIRKVKIKHSYLCLKCNKQFVEADGFERMRHKPELIVRAVHMHEDGMSLSKVQNHLWQHDNVKVTRWTISEWTKKYSVFL